MAAETTKKCPRCAETIQGDAVMCRFCGYTYGTPVIPMQPGTSLPPKTNGLAVASLVLGIVWVYGLGSLLALIFGIVGRNQIKKSEGAQTGGGMALAGTILGVVGLIIVAVAFASFFSGRITSSQFSCVAQSITEDTLQC